jgi:hypothetical protein
MVLKSKKTRSIFSRIKGLIFVIVSYSIYQIIKQKDEKIEDIWRIIQQIFQKENALLLIVVFLLIPINWALEALKWQKLAQKIEKISFFEAYRGVLVGLALATTTPLMIGDYVGKIWMLRTDRRLESIGAILLGNSIQTFVSLLFGTVSYVAFIWLNRDTYFWIHVYLVCTLIVSMIFGFWAVSNRHKINFLFDRFKFFRLFRKYLAVFQNYSLSEIRQILLIGICRYLVFTTQFIILLIVFDIQLPIPTLFYGVCLIFLSRTLASTLSFIGDLSVRELTSLYYFSHFAVSALTISTATLMIWLINVLFPIIIGVFFIWQLRISVKE